MKLPGLKGEWMVPDQIEVNEVGVPTYTWTWEIGMKEFKPLTKEEITSMRGRTDEAAYDGEGIKIGKEEVLQALDEVEFWRSAILVFKNMSVGEEDQTAFLVALQDWKRMGGVLGNSYVPPRETTIQRCPVCQGPVMKFGYWSVMCGLPRSMYSESPIVCECERGHQWRLCRAM